ncbi:unnamed protein product [Ixodes hexagonus]
MASTSSCKDEPATEPLESTAAVQLRDIKNIVLKNQSGLFSSNIFCDEALSAMREKLQRTTNHDDPAVKNIFTAAPVSKKKAGNKKIIAEDITKDAVVLGDSSDDDCSILSQPHLTKTSPLKCSPTSPANLSPVKHSRKTMQILKRLETLAKLDDEPSWCLSDDSSDLFCLDDDLVEQEKDLVLLVQAQCRLLKYTIAPSAHFGDIFERLAKEFDVAPSQIILSWKEGPIQTEDTPSSLGITPADILECIVRKCTPAEVVGPRKNAMTVKFQCSNKRMTENIEVSKASDEPLLEGAKAFAEKASLVLSKLVLKFDGEKVDPRMTPDQLGIEDGDCVDVSVRS